MSDVEEVYVLADYEEQCGWKKYVRKVKQLLLMGSSVVIVHGAMGIDSQSIVKHFYPSC